MDNAIILKLYNGDICFKASRARAFQPADFFSNMEGAVSITVWLSVSIILYDTHANQFSVFQEIMQFIPKVC